MTTQAIHRPTRATRPVTKPAALSIQAPPTLPERHVNNPLHVVLPIVGGASSLLFMAAAQGTTYLLLGVATLSVTVLAGGISLLSHYRHTARTRRIHRARYLDYLEHQRALLLVAETDIVAEATLCDPPPLALYDVIRDGRRLWERRPGDDDFLHVRVGSGNVSSSVINVKEDDSALLPSDPFLLREAQAVQRRFSTTPRMPLLVPLNRAACVSVCGVREGVLRAARALLIQTAALHAPGDVQIAIVCPRGCADWEWVTWLPHALETQGNQALGTPRIVNSLEELAALLVCGTTEQELRTAQELSKNKHVETSQGRQLLVVHDFFSSEPLESHSPRLLPDNACLLHLVDTPLSEPDHVDIRLSVHNNSVTIEEMRAPSAAPSHGRLDDLGESSAEGLARMLAPLRLSTGSGLSRSKTASFATLLGIDDIESLDFARLWSERPADSFLCVPLGINHHGKPVLLDLKESGQGGMGPHGLCVGATGSGKSELLRTVVLGLCATHSPRQLAFMLIDYKGGATFSPFHDVPHISGLVTNLHDDAALVQRAHASLAGEVERRQHFLSEIGKVRSIADYRAMEMTNPDLPSLPHLLVIIDEFGELLSAQPDFLDLFLRIGRIGRSIGVHLLLASQRIDGSKLHGLETYLSYRCALRTFSEEESRAVLGTLDAFTLPPQPGHGYLKVGTHIYQHFVTAYVSGADTSRNGGGDHPLVARLPTMDTQHAATTDPPIHDGNGQSALDIVVTQLRSTTPAASPIWLAPLPSRLTLDAVLEQSEPQPVAVARRSPSQLMRIPLGLLDDPKRQHQGPWTVDLSANGGHSAIIGGPQSGKSTVLRTVTASLALTHSPRQAIIYGVDLMGGSLTPLRRFPHVGGIAGRSDRERIRRTVAHVHAMLDHRDHVFTECGIDSVDELRVRHGNEEIQALPSADVVLLIDGFDAIRTDFLELDELVHDIMRRGSGYGVHVVAAILRWSDVRPTTQSSFGTRIELQLNDPTESAIDRRLAETLKGVHCGRALTEHKLFAQVALPRVDGMATTAELTESLDVLGDQLSSLWPAEVAPPVRVLPSRLPAQLLADVDTHHTQVPIGIAESALQPVFIDLFGSDQHLLVFGDGKCGKSNLLRVIAQGLAARFDSDDVSFAVVDPRVTLQGIVRQHYVKGYARNSDSAHRLATLLAKTLHGRIAESSDYGLAPSDDESPLAGPRIVVLVDDYDMLIIGGQQPLGPLLPFLPAARDIGLHVVLTRTVTGAARASFDPVLLALRESGCAALVMNGDHTEGPLIGGVAARKQPVGRGVWIRRAESAELVQTALFEGQ